MKNLYIYFLVIIFIIGCKSEEVNIEFSEQEKLYMPYDNYGYYIFKNNIGLTDTLHFNNYTQNEHYWCEFFVCPRYVYQPIMCNIYFDFQNQNIEFYFHKTEDTNSFISKIYFNFENNKRETTFDNYNYITTLEINNIIFDSVLVFENDTTYKLKKLYFKKGIGILKYEINNYEEWTITKQ